MSNTSFYSDEELRRLGFQKCGNDVRISRKASIYGANHISIGNHVRVDDFCILSGKVTLGDHIHIAAGTALYGGTKGIVMEDFSNISSRICIYALSDDYSGRTMTNPMIPDEYKAVCEKPVLIKRHVIVGTGSTILPGVTLEEGTAVGAMSLVKESTEEWGIYAGIPARRLKDREKGLLELEKAFLKENHAEHS